MWKAPAAPIEPAAPIVYVGKGVSGPNQRAFPGDGRGMHLSCRRHCGALVARLFMLQGLKALALTWNYPA